MLYSCNNKKILPFVLIGPHQSQRNGTGRMTQLSLVHPSLKFMNIDAWAMLTVELFTLSMDGTGLGWLKLGIG